MSEQLQLFHQIVDPGSARVRQFITERGLEESVVFRNVSFDKNLEKLKGHGGEGIVPALWDGEKLFVGADVVIARLSAHLDVGRG